MRLDKYLVSTGRLSRKEAAAAARAGRVTVNGTVCRSADRHINEDGDEIALDGAVISYRRYEYVWLNKPAGYVSATEDGNLPCVTDLLTPELRKRGLFPCGRLDRDTVGLMLLTDDGTLSHRLLTPRRHVEKEYRFSCEPPLPPGAEDRFAGGIVLGDETCKPAALRCNGDRMGGVITLTEGKYHQIKRMVEACGSRVTALERISFAGIGLDPALPRGAIRPLTPEEIESLRRQAD